MKKIGFIGIGVMGKSMVKNLVKKGFELKIYSRTKEKARELIESGVEWCDTIKECVKDQDVVITMVGFPKDVREVYFGDQGIIENVTEGTYLIDMTTTSPQLSMEIYAKAKDKGCYALDAPVSGGDIGAQKGTLSIMVGGDKEAFESCHCILEAMGTTIIYEGKAGFGQHTKMSNQIAVAAGIAGTCESIAYAKKVGLSLSTMLKSITEGAGGSWQLSNMGPKVIREDYAPGFFVKHFIKDMKIIEDEARLHNIKLPVLEQVLKLYQILEKEGYEEYGTQILIKYYELF